MNSKEKFITTIKQIIDKNSGPRIQEATMTSSNTCILKNGIELKSTMLMFNESLLKPVATVVNGEIETGGGGYDPHTHSFIDKSVYISPLQSGDKVLIQKCTDKNKYIVLCRLIEGV